MNPPFEKGADAAHIQHAYEQLKPGGRLVAIASSGGGRGREKFDSWIEQQGGTIEENPAGSFAGSDAFRQTGVKTRLIVLDKPGEAQKNSKRIYKGPFLKVL